MYIYGKKLYWNLINVMLAYRCISTGMIDKGGIQGNYKKASAAIKMITSKLGGVPVVGSILSVVNGLTSILYAQCDSIVIQNVKKRVQCYKTQNQISQDIANSVLLILQQSKIQKRIKKMKQKDKYQNSIQEFLKKIKRLQENYHRIAGIFAKQLKNLQKDKQDQATLLITQNALLDTSLIFWKFITKPITSKTNKPMTQAVNFYIQEINSKKLRIGVRSALINVNQQLIGNMTPYCQVRCGKQIKKTKVDRSKTCHQSPQWNQFLQFNYPQTPIKICLEVYDYQTFFKDDFLGSAQIWSNQIHQKIKGFKLMRNGKQTGLISATVTVVQ